MAEIRGTVWNDLNGNDVQDAGEAGLPNVTILLDSNDNGNLDAGETSITTDANGDYAFTNLESDTYIVTQILQPGFTQTVPTVAPSSQFDIDIVFPDNSLTAAQQAVFTTAANIWEEIIVGDLSSGTNIPLESGGTQAFVDDLVIEATAPAIDGPGNILGSAGPRFIRSSNSLPISGIMEFDSADIAEEEAAGKLEDLILHEMGHVLGIGTIWDNLGLITGEGGVNPQYTGATGVAQYSQISGNAETSIPVENTGGAGTRDGHWRESVFDNELMTGFSETGNEPLSRITVGSLKDLGYEIDFRTAEAYSLPVGALGSDSSTHTTESGSTHIITRPEIEVLNDAASVEVLSAASVGNSVDASASAVAPAGTYLVTVAPAEVVNNLDFGNECFLTGTLILTEKGEIAVENLKIADIVYTADGKLEPIKWIGRQTIEPTRVKNPLRGYPILVKAGALGDNLPHRDLYVSPDHSLFIEGLLINAGALVNDISILKTEPTETFTYYHVELENHALLLAEGAAAESYLPQKENRDQYDNAAEYEELYPHGSNLMLWPMDYPRVSSWHKVPRFVSKKLLKIAHQLEGQELELRA